MGDFTKELNIHKVSHGHSHGIKESICASHREQMKRENNLKSFALDFTKKQKPSILKFSARQTDDVLTHSMRTKRVPKIMLTKTMVFSKDMLKGPAKDALSESEQSSSDTGREKPYSFFQGKNEPPRESISYTSKIDLSRMPKKQQKMYEKQS